MKFKCSTPLLQEATNITIKAASTSASQQLLSGLCIIAEKEGVKLICNNGEVAIEYKIDAKVSETGCILVSSRLFGDIVRKFTAEEVEFEADAKHKVSVKCGKTHFDINGMSPDDFPSNPEIVPEYEVTIGVDMLRELIKGTAFAASTSESKVMLTGCLLEVEEGLIRMVALDGYRMALKEFVVKEKNQEGKVVIPAKSLHDFNRIVTDVEKDVKIRASAKNIAFELDNVKFISRVLSGEYVDYKKTIPQEFENEFKIDVSRLQLSIERTALMIINDMAKAPVVLGMNTEGLNLSCTTMAGKADDFIPVEIAGKEMTIAFNHRYLLDAIKSSNCDEISMKFGSNVSPCLIEPVDAKDETFKYVVLPVRL